MTPNQKLVLNQGSTEEIAFVLFDVEPVLTLGPDGESYTGGVETDLTGATFACQFRGVTKDGPVEAELNAGRWVVELREWEGYGELQTVVAELSYDETSVMVSAKGFYDIEMTIGTDRRRVLEGEYELSNEVTKEAGAPI